jgi:hypothetical protein
LPTDTKGITRTHEGKTLRVWFPAGEIAIIRVGTVDVHEDCSECSGYAGSIYDIVETNRPERYKGNPINSTYWSEFPDIQRWELIEERNS